MFSEKLILALVGQIYDAAADSDQWPVFLESLAESLDGRQTQLIFYDVERHGGNLAMRTRLDPSVQAKYNEYYAGVDVWGIHGRDLMTSGNVTTGQMLCPDPILVNSEFYNDFLRPNDAFHQVGGFIHKDKSVVSFVSSLRPQRAGPFSEENILLLHELMPHLQRALQIHRKINGLEAKANSYAKALDRLPIGLMVIDSKGRVLQLNHSAQDILNLNDGLTLSANGLVAHRPQETNQLRALILGAISGLSGEGVGFGGPMTLPRPSLQRPFQILVTPLRSSASLSWLGKAAAAVFVSDPERQSATSETTLGKLFDLTPAESRLAASLMRGKDLREIAEEFELSRNTVRSQLRSLFDKTATRRQGELIRLLWNSPAQIRAD
jgi:DNA-binding CsgD family transcriptional regulator/PAS domain-containing protein